MADQTLRNTSSGRVSDTWLESYLRWQLQRSFDLIGRSRRAESIRAQMMSAFEALINRLSAEKKAEFAKRFVMEPVEPIAMSHKMVLAYAYRRRTPGISALARRQPFAGTVRRQFAKKPRVARPMQWARANTTSS